MTDRYAVFGNPLSHTKSPLIHMTFARQTGEDIDYQAIEAPPGRFPDALSAFFAGGGRGCNVTAPFKLEANALATRRLPRAELAGAANCLKVEGGEIVADNFDGIGLLRDIEINLGQPLAGRRVLLLGAGGAARGALLPFLEARPAALMLVNRTVEKAHALARHLASHGPITSGGYDDLNDMSFDIVVNATSASLRGEMPPLPDSAFGGAALAYDLVYGKGLTPFLSRAQAHTVAGLADGVGMLVEQAAEAFVWWRGVRPDTARMITTLTIPLT